MMYRDIRALAAACLLSSGCSLIFSSEVEPVAEADRPLYQFDFEESGANTVISTGRSALVLDIIGSAVVEGGALRLDQSSSGFVGSAQSSAPANEAYAECLLSEEATVAAWLTLDDMVAGTVLPSRIFSMENRQSDRKNFTLGQGLSPEYNSLVGRIGRSSEVSFPIGLINDGQPVFVAYSVHGGNRYDYQIGDDWGTGINPSSDDNWMWEEGRPVSIGAADTGERPWRGLVHHLEFYCRYLDQAELEILKKKSKPD